MKYICSICGYVYDETSEGTAFADLPDSWSVRSAGLQRICSAPRRKLKQRLNRHIRIPQLPDHLSMSIRIMPEKICISSPPENFPPCARIWPGDARNSTKMKKPVCFARLPLTSRRLHRTEPDGDLTHLLSLFENDLTIGYPAVQSAAQTTGDRGTQRVCVWGQKVTVILNSLVQRYQREGSAFLRNTQIWVCSVCGFAYVGDTPPELCPYAKFPPGNSIR